jgi:predicted nucleic acid-binding Zn ribbon protein
MPSYTYKCRCGNEIIITCSMRDYSATTYCECGELAERKPEDLVPQNYIVNTTGFYGKSSK